MVPPKRPPPPPIPKKTEPPATPGCTCYTKSLAPCKIHTKESDLSEVEEARRFVLVETNLQELALVMAQLDPKLISAAILHRRILKGK